MPAWLRPVPLQLQVQHPAWIDRIPWPSARTYLINHPQINFDDFASYYSSSFHLSWPYEHAHVLVSTSSNPNSSPEAAFNDWFLPRKDTRANEGMPKERPVLNPVFEQHLRLLSNWSVSNHFKKQFPELCAVIDADSEVDWNNQECMIMV